MMAFPVSSWAEVPGRSHPPGMGDLIVHGTIPVTDPLRFPAIEADMAGEDAG